MSTTVQQVASGTYELDPVHSSFGFAIKHNAVATFRGNFEQVQGKLEDGVLTGSAQVDSVKTPIPQLREHLLSPDFFDAAQHPTIDFRSNEITVAEDGTVELDGELTIKGVTKPVKARGTYAEAVGISGKDVIGIALEASIDRREYGIDWQAELPKGGKVLGWDVKLEINLELASA